MANETPAEMYQRYLASTGASSPGPSVFSPAGVPLGPGPGGLPAAAAMEETPDERYRRYQSRKIERTMDGDTMEALNPSTGLVETFRFDGIDAPESAQGDLGKKSQAFLDSMLKNAKDVHLGSAGVDKHGRQTSVLYADGKNLNLELVRNGHAQVYDRYLNKLSPEMAQELTAAQEEAKKGGLGIWAPDSGFIDPEKFRRAQESTFGDAASAMGHVKLPRRDDGVESAKERWYRYMKETGQAVPQRAPRDPNAVPAEFRYPEEHGFLGHVLGGLGYAGNISKSAIYGALDKGLPGALQYAGQAASKDRQTTAGQLKDKLAEQVGVDKPRMGKDDGKFQLGDIGDYALDLGLDVATDPITWLTTGWGSLAKHSAEFGAGKVAAEAGLETAEATRYAKYAAGGRAALGATFAAGSVDENAPLPAKIAAGVAGAAFGVKAPELFESAGSGLRKAFDSRTNWYARKTRGSAFGDYANQKALALDAFDKKKNYAELLRQGRLEALDGLPADERLQVNQLMEQLKTSTIEYRNDLVQKMSGGKSAQDGVPQVILDKATQLANDHVTENVLPKLVAGQAASTVEAIGKWAEHNENMVQLMNVVADKDMIPLKFHIPDVFRKEDLEKVEDVLLKSQIKRAMKLDRSGAAGEIGHDAAYAVYSEGFAKNFLNDKEREAMDLVKRYKETVPTVPGAAGFEKALGFFDHAQNFIKGNMLYFSLSWVKNNFFDNLAKSLVENGVAGVLDSGTMGAFRKGLSRDVLDLYRGNITRSWTGEHMADMLHYGVLDNPTFKSMNDAFTREFLFAPEKVKEATRGLAAGVNKARDWWFQNPVIKTMSSSGSFMEGTARATTYMHSLEALQKGFPKLAANPAGLEKLKEAASNIVKRTFFDYGDVTAFEKATMKRIIPFYSFYSKNLPYWVKSALDPAKSGRVLAVEKMRKNVGKDPTALQYAGMTPYVESNAPRDLGRDGKGRTAFMLSPSGSMYDAVKMMDLRPSSIRDQLIEKGSAPLKLGAELATKQDLFTGEPLLPSQTPGGKKFLFSAGFFPYGIRKGLEAAGVEKTHPLQQALGTGNVEVDHNGNPYTKSDYSVYLDRIMSTLLPHGVADQVAGSIGKLAYGKETPEDSVYNRFMPTAKASVSKGAMRMTRMRNAKDKGD